MNRIYIVFLFFAVLSSADAVEDPPKRPLYIEASYGPASVHGPAIGRLNNHDTFYAEALGAALTNSVERRAIMGYALINDSVPRAHASVGKVTFEYLLFDWLGLGRSVEIQKLTVSNLRDYQKPIYDYTLSSIILFPTTFANAQPGITELAALKKMSFHKTIFSGGYDATLHKRFESVAGYIRLSGDPFTRFYSFAVGGRYYFGRPFISIEGFASRVQILTYKTERKVSGPAYEQGVRLGIGANLR